MRILIVTPLFPPDTARSAQYAKELSARLSNEHDVTVLLYGHLPEAVPNVKLISVDKRRTAPLRIFSFMRTLQVQSWLNEVVLIQNGPSVELPALFTLKYSKKPIILMESDQSALKRTLSHPFYKSIYKNLKLCAQAFYTKNDSWPLEKPTVHPLKPSPVKEIERWKKSWDKHLSRLLTLIEQYHAKH